MNNLRLKNICVNTNFNYFSGNSLDIFKQHMAVCMRSFVTVGLLTICMSVFAQDGQFTQYMFNRLSFNPAYAGAREAICGTLVNRQQYMGFEGNPTTTVFSAHSNFNAPKFYQNNAGVGLTVMQDEIGLIKTFSAKLAYAYRQAFNFAPGYFSLGVDAGIVNKSFGSDWQPGQTPPSLDNAIPNAGAAGTTFDLGVGLYYYNGERLYAGVSAMHLNQSAITDELEDDFDLNYDLRRTYYLTAGYMYPLDTRTPMELEPSILVKSDVTSTQIDVNLLYLYDNSIWAGVTYRHLDAVAGMMGYDFGSSFPSLEGLRAGISYDFTTSDLKTHNDGSLEFMINYCYKIVPPIRIQKYRTVKWL